jgi:hypothetical protein
MIVGVDCGARFSVLVVLCSWAVGLGLNVRRPFTGRFIYFFLKHGRLILDEAKTLCIE